MPVLALNCSLFLVLPWGLGPVVARNEGERLGKELPLAFFCFLFASSNSRKTVTTAVMALRFFSFCCGEGGYRGGWWECCGVYTL